LPHFVIFPLHPAQPCQACGSAVKFVKENVNRQRKCATRVSKLVWHILPNRAKGFCNHTKRQNIKTEAPVKKGDRKL